MSPTTNRRKRKTRARQSDNHETQKKESTITTKNIPDLPTWNWRTFPVIMAFGLGGFLGMILGAESGIIATIALFIFVGILGFSLSRLAIRFLMLKGLIKPQPQRNK
jgi:hypothetical protein|tara:strand:- start:552 stop:872 length:321 start_codon:yes stop_codon:yes gene_type:complete